jgi:hypothetical protein
MNEVFLLEESEVLRELALIRYHQRLIVDMLAHSNSEFFKLVIYYGLTEEEVQEFYKLCDDLNMELEEQKAEGFVYYHPLYLQFKEALNSKISPKEVIHACISQRMYLPLMEELQKYT